MQMFMKILFILIIFTKGRGYELKQVIVLSRHNIRTPWSPNMESLTPQKWPGWYGNPGDLTPKGRWLEHHMGKYFADWMIQEKLLDCHCPKDSVFVYANSKLRAIESAKSFSEGAFGSCVGTYYKNITDPVFATIIRNRTAEFKAAVITEMQKVINKVDLKNAFQQLDKILDIKNSSYCKYKNICDLSEEKSKVVLEFNKEPDVLGALRIGCIVVDSFLMAYYDGMTKEYVAWGQIPNTQQWKGLLKILDTCQKLRFAIKILDRDVASTMLKYLTNLFQNGKMKFYLLVGHDSNVISLLSSLRFKDYILRDQIENTPVGGKLVFQKWHDKANSQDLLKVNYVYHSTKQIRDGVKVTLLNPPQWQMLEMESCAVDKNGFCPWNRFLSELNQV